MKKIQLAIKSAGMLIALLLRSKEGEQILQDGIAALKKRVAATKTPVDDIALKIAIETAEELLGMELD